MLRLYNVLLLPIRAAAGLWYLRHRGSPARRDEARERTARALPGPLPGALWIHGSSVGEARVVSLLARALRRQEPEMPLALSAFTRTGHDLLEGDPSADTVFYLPLDFPGHATRLIDALRPRMLAIVETELWPNLLHEAHRSGLPVVIVNGRLSPDRMNRYRRFSALYRPLLARLAAVGAQSDEDADRFEELGVPAAAIRVTGNVKYDLPAPLVSESELRSELGLAPARPVFVAGSTGAGEDAPVLDAFEKSRRDLPDLFLVLAPRHPQRCDDVEGLLRQRDLPFQRLSRLDGHLSEGTSVLLVDTLGQLGRLYALAAVAFVGGSLVPVGGHNVLEPASLGVPVLFGEHTQHFAEPAQALLDSAGGRRVTDGAALARVLGELLANEPLRKEAARNAEQVVASNRGALRRSVEMMLPLLRRDAAERGRARPVKP